MLNRHGHIFLFAILILGLGGGLVAYDLFPALETVSQRQAEEKLGFSLSEMRMAISLDRLRRETPLFESDWNTRSNLVAYLEALRGKGLLREIPQDPMTAPEKWGTASEKLFWLPARNVVASSGFETDTLAETSWKLGSSKVAATITRSLVWPGDTIGGTGHAVIIIQD